MRPEDRGKFALSPGRPKQYRRVNGQIVAEFVGERSDEDDMNDALAGVTEADLRGSPSGFIRHFAKQHQAGAGAGPDVGERPRRYQTDYSNAGSDEPSQDLADLLGDDASADLLGQPVGREFERAVRPEEADIVGPRARPSARPSAHRPAEYEGDEDLFDMSLVAPYNPTGRPDKPVIASRPRGLAEMFRQMDRRRR